MRGKVLSLIILILLLGPSVSAQFDYLVVDDFDSYADNNNLRAVWKDLWSGSLFGLNGGEVFVETSPDLVIDGNSMRYYFRNFNTKGGYGYVGSEAEANTADLEAGVDWTVGGVKALTLYFLGDPCNLTDTSGVIGGIHQDQMYLALEDGDSNVGIVKYPDMSAIKEPFWHEWNIDLEDPCLSSVDMNNVAKVYIGFGGQKIGQTKAGAGNKTSVGDTVWFDDIRLYPPRCLPEVTKPAADFTNDCRVDINDLDVMAADWLLTDGYFLTENRPAVLTGFPDETSHWTTDCAVGTGAIEVNEGYNITVTDPRLYGIASMSITVWIRQNIENEFVGIVSSRERPCGDMGEATELGHYWGPYSHVVGLGYDWSCLQDCWKHDAELDVPDDGTWTFCALVVDPTGASAYMRPAGSALQTGIRNAVAHPPQQNFAQSFMIGRGSKDGGYFKGAIDDVRIYDYNLSFTDVNNLAYQIADPNPWPVYWYKFDETSGYTAADSGTPTEVYTMNVSSANLVPKDPCDSEDPNLGSFAFDPNNMDIVNFLDYAVLADNWLEEFLWPPQP
jgi:hypothetical protein